MQLMVGVAAVVMPAQRSLDPLATQFTQEHRIAGRQSEVLPTLAVALARAAQEAAMAGKESMVTEGPRAAPRGFLQLGQANGNVVANISAQILKSARTLDDLLMRCDQQQRVVAAAREIARQKETRIQADLASNSAARLTAQGVASRKEATLSRTHDEILEARKHCEEQTESSKEKMTKLQDGMQPLKDMKEYIAKCKDQKKGVLMQQVSCVDSQVFAEPVDTALRQQLANLTVGFARQELQAAFQGTLERQTDTASSMSHAGADEATQPCRTALTGEVSCNSLDVELRRVMGRMQEQLRDASIQHGKHEETCEAQRNNHEDVLDASRRQQADAIEQLSRATAALADLSAARTANEQDAEARDRSAAADEQVCLRDAAALEEQVCTLTKVRKAADERQGGGAPIQDCVVSEWVFSTCSKQCTNPGDENGLRVATRKVFSPPSPSGMQCLPLELEMSCGTEPCPQDCEVSNWSEWSGCSQSCGGGVRTRNRQVEKEPQNTNRRCPETVNTQTCNSGSCDVECELSEWTPWSSCSRSCKYGPDAPAGQQHQTRGVRTPGTGDGACPPQDDTKRFKTQECGADLCPANFSCVEGGRSEDIYVLIDGSVVSNFSAQLVLARQLIAYAPTTARFGVVAYGKRARILSRLSADRASLSAALRAPAAPGGDPDLSQGEVLARSLLSAAQPPAEHTTVLVLTDGDPTAAYPAQVIAAGLREEGVRVLVGLASTAQQSQERACELASSPCQDHVVSFGRWEVMAEEPLRLLTAICTIEDHSGNSTAAKHPVPAHTGV